MSIIIILYSNFLSGKWSTMPYICYSIYTSSMSVCEGSCVFESHCFEQTLVSF